MGVGLDLDLVIVLGLAEGSFPAPVRDDSLLPDSEREAAGGELAAARPARRAASTASSSPRSPAPTRSCSASRVATCGAAASGCRRAGCSTSRPRSPVERWWSEDLLGAKADWVKHVASFDAGLRRLSFPATEQEHRLRALLAAADVPRPTLAAVAERSTHHARRRRQGGRRPPQRRVHPLRRQPRRSRHPVAGRPGHVGHQPRAVGRLPACLLRPEPARRAKRSRTPRSSCRSPRSTRGSLVHEVLETFILEVLAPPSGRTAGARSSRGRPPTATGCSGRSPRIGATSTRPSGLTGRPIFWRRDRASILADLRPVPRRGRRAPGAHRALARSPPSWPSACATGSTPCQLPAAATVGCCRCGARPTASTSDDRRHPPRPRLQDRQGATSFPALTEDDPDHGGPKLQLAVYGAAARQHRTDRTLPSRRTTGSSRPTGSSSGSATTSRRRSSTGSAPRIGTIVDGIEAGVFASHPGIPTLRSPSRLRLLRSRRARHGSSCAGSGTASAGDPELASYAELGRAERRRRRVAWRREAD